MDTSLIPSPVFDRQPGYVDLYWLAWKQAWDHVLERPGLPQSPYMDEGAWPDSIWIWDTCFMSLFCKYSPGQFPGVESLRNFYVPLHDLPMDGTYPMNIRHPDNPPLLAWVEYDNFLFNGDEDHVRQLLLERQYLQKHFEWFDRLQPEWKYRSKVDLSAPVAIRRMPLGYRWHTYQSGMDNTPRAHGDQTVLWVDAIAQQGLSALYIARLAKRLGEADLAERWRQRYDRLKQLVNEYYWDEADGLYYDVSEDGSTLCKVRTPASYWPMLAEMCDERQAAALAKNAADLDVFGGQYPWPTLTHDDPAFVPEDGEYWRGSVWLPTAYMATKALEKYGARDIADANAEKLLHQMWKTCVEFEPHTIWECYSPTRDMPGARNGRLVRKDFCGWSALGPISMFIENVLGFHTVDCLDRRVHWRLHQPGRHGVENLRFGPVRTDILADGKGRVTVQSNLPYTLVINDTPHSIPAGSIELSLPT